MCLFVTIYVPRSISADAVIASAARDCGVVLTKVHNDCVGRQLNNMYHQYIVSSEDCNCNTAIGKTQILSKIRKRGWRPGKIKKWLRDATDVALWLGLFRHICGTHSPSQIGFLLHDYRGDVSAEVFSVRARRALDISVMTEELLVSDICRDTFYEVTHPV